MSTLEFKRGFTLRRESVSDHLRQNMELYVVNRLMVTSPCCKNDCPPS